MASFGQLSAADYAVLNNGVCTDVVDQGEVVAQHYHFIGAPFSGLWKKKETNNQLIRKEKKRLVQSRKWATKTPSLKARLTNEGWDIVLSSDNNDIRDMAFVCDKDARKMIEVVDQIKKFRTFKIRQALQRFYQLPEIPTSFECLVEELLFIINNDTVINVEADEINHRQHATNGNIHCSIIHTEIATFVFDVNCKNFNEFANAILEARVDEGDTYIANQVASLLFGRVTDCHVYKIMSEIWWDQLLAPTLIMPIRFSTMLDDLDVTKEALILERFRILSEPPQMHMEKVNTKRDSKRRKPKGNDRLERLENTHPKIAIEKKAREEYNRLQKIYAKQKEQRNLNSLKMIDKLELHGFSIPVKITFPQFQQLSTKVLEIIPQQLRNNIHWIDVFTALYTLVYSTDYSARWLAIRALYVNFKIEGVKFAVFAALIFKLYKLMGDKSEVECPKIHAEMAKIHYVEASAPSIIITLILTILFKQDPRKNTVDKILSSFKDVPTSSTGMEMVVNAASRTFDFIAGSYADENSLEYRLNKLDCDVKELMSPEGQKRLREEKGAFEEVYLMKVEALELARFIRANTTQGVLLNKLDYNINTQYAKAQILGASGHGYRRRPVVLHLNGSAGIGKTRLINYISADTISLILQLENDKYLKEEYKEELREKVENYEQFVYFRPVGLKYQQNFKSYASKIYVCDDANQISPSFQNGETTYPMELIHLNNSHDHMLNVAEIEKKADALFKSSLVIATDNISRPDLFYLVCADAYDRRIDFTFTVQIKKEFRKQRIGRSGIRYEVDVTTIDPAEANTHIYEFLDENNIKYTYEEVIEMVEEKLVEVAEHHVEDIQVFKKCALESFKRRQFKSFNMSSPLATEMASHFHENVGGASRVLYNKHNEQVVIESHPEDDKPRVAGMLTRIKRKTRNVFHKVRTEVNDKVEDIVESVNKPQEVSFKDRIIETKNTFQMMIFAFLLNFISWRTLDKWERKLRKTKSIILKNKEIILATAGVLSTLLLGYMYYKKTTPTKRVNKSEARREHKNLYGKYDGGQPTKSAPKGKSPPKTPIRSTPIFQSSEECSKETIHDIDEFIRTPNLHMACQRANSVAQALVSNSYYIFIDYIVQGKKTCLGLRGFFIKDRIFITNRHLLPFSKEECDTIHFSLYNRFCEYENIPIAKVSINTFTHTNDGNNLYYDLIWIDFGKENMKCHADLTQYSKNNGSDNFLTEAEMKDLMGTKIIVCTLSIAQEIAQINRRIDFTGKCSWFYEMQHTKITQVNTEAMRCMGRENEDLYTYCTFEYPMQSVPGYCGSVVICNDAAYPGKILGIHMAGYKSLDKSFGQLITKEMIDSICSLSVHMRRIPGDYNTFLKADSFEFLRTIPHVLRAPSKTKLRKSIFYNKIYPSQKAPAHLSFAPDGEHVIEKSMRKYLTPHQTISTANEHLFTSILHYKVTNTRRLRELNREEAIKGIEGNEYICAINRRSSAGYPLNVETRKTGKHEYLGENEEWILDHPRVQQLIDQFLESVENNERPDVVFVATLKDELLKLSKVEQYKSRAFAAAPLHFTIIFREKYLDYFATVMENKIKNYSLVGVNMYSHDVNTLVETLLEVAPRNSRQFLAGDFTNFDGTLNLNLLWQIFYFIETLYDRKSKVCEALWTELVDSQQLFGNTVIHVSRGQPSGNPATTLINTLYNMGLCYMVLFEVMEEINTIESYAVQEDLVNNYRGMYYGDDNLHSFHKKTVDIMDPNLITLVMGRHGHVYTTDAKDSTHFEYRSLSEVTILKRHIVYDEVTHQWIAPLELVSIFEPINWDRIKDNQYELKELQMQVNIRTAIRELSLHTSEIFNTYVPKLLEESRKYGLTLEPECFYTQYTLRKIIRNSDNLLFFSNDYFLSTNKPYNIDLDLLVENKWGTTIQLGERPESSPLEDSQQTMCHQFNPTVNTHQWIANTYEQVKQESNNKKMHADNGNYSFSGSGSNGAAIPFQIPAIPENSLVSISLSASADSERSGTVLVTSDWFDIGARFEAQTTTTQQLTTLPRGITNAVAHITTPVTSTCRFVFTLNVSPPLPTSATVPEPLWVRQYESGEPTREIPQVHMMQYNSPAEENVANEQITTLDTVTALQEESVPRNIELNLEEMKTMKEAREHTIKDVLCRMYAIRDINVPAGGTTGTPIVELDLLAELLSQNNISAKLEGFAIMRTNLIVTIVTRTLATTSGGLMASFYPQFSDITNRNRNVLQNSQTPNKRINLAGSEGIRMKVLFISAFYGRNLITDSGNIGHFVLKQLTQLNINATGLRIYIQADKDNVTVEYPTFAVGANTLRNIELRLSDLQQEQAQALRRVQIDAVNMNQLRREINERLPMGVREDLPDLIPRVHMMKKTVSSGPVKSVKWQPGMNHLNKDGVDITHSLAMTRLNTVNRMIGQYGSGFDEMTIDHISKSQQLIAVKRVLTSYVANRVVYARPCSLVDFLEDNGDIFLTHQTWLAMKAQKWSAKLHFEITAYINNFHSVTLRAIFNPNDTGDYNEGDILNYNNINKAKSYVMEFDGQRMINQFVVEPALTTALKNVPTPRSNSVDANVNDWLASCFDEECSYGMFYLVIEVPLHATAQVAPFFDFTVDFHTTEMLLGDPCEFDQLLPSVHMMKSGLTAEVAETSHQQNRSEVFENAGESRENALNTKKQQTIQTCLGDSIEHISDLLSVFTPFCPIKQVQNGQALQINPFIFRVLNDMAVSEQFHNSDSIDYFAAGFGYYQGGMDVRIGKTTEQQGPFGELMLTSARNMSVPISSTSGTGTAIITAPISARSGCRVIPLYKEECIPQVEVPYYQPFHIARVTNTNSFNSGNQPKIMLLRPYNTEYYRIFRAARKDFSFGFLTALPPFKMVVGSMYT